MEMWGSVIRELCAVPALLWLAIQDKRYLGITPRGLLAVSVILLFSGQFGTVSRESALGGAMIGAILIVCSYFSKEAIGIADSVVVLACGAAFGLWGTVTFVFFAMLYAGVCSAVLLVAKKAGKKSRIPFLPFLLLGYLTMRMLEVYG